MKIGHITFRLHALERMFEREISESDVQHVLRTGEVIEDYPKDYPYPSRLLLGWCGNRPIHVVAAFDERGQETIVITVYEPDRENWDGEFRGRIK